MKIGIAQINAVIGDFSHNEEKVRAFAQKGARQGLDLVLFPELVLSGYPPRDLLEKSDFIDANERCLNRLVRDIEGVGVLLGTILRRKSESSGKGLLNSAVLFEDGRVRHRAAKRLLPAYDVFDEIRYFQPGRRSEPFAYKGYRVGLTVCEDVWNDKDFFDKPVYHADPVRSLAEKGMDLLLNISASPFHGGKAAFRWKMLGSIAKKYGVPLIYANQVGGNDGLLFDGVSSAFAPDGRLIANAADFEEDLITVDLDAMSGDKKEIASSETDSIYRALVMGTRDYVRKCGFSKAVIGLSGGIDSALTAVVAADALGKENVLTVFMPSGYTSRDNYEDTARLAKNLGVEYRVIPIDDMFDAFLGHLSPSFDKSAPGVTEQNIQARVRGTILMAISNARGCLLLTTGNKSEMAVGYCTLYGDMSGGLAVISDVPKTVVYDISRHINRDQERIPQRIITKAPSAELKPEQTDQDDLPDYAVLDEILDRYIRQAKSPTAIISEGFDEAVVRDVVRRVDRNEYKRQQAPPGLRVTSKAFGVGRRYPIAQRYTHSY